MATMLSSPPEMIDHHTELELSFVCTNPEHRIVAARREQVRLRDRRWLAPPGRIPQRDYCASEGPADQPLRFRGRAAYCALGDLVDDHEWIEATVLAGHRARNA
jgi:hypothetical protein